jgi:hypothetical protein
MAPKRGVRPWPRNWIAARRWTMRAIDAGPTLGRLLEGISNERARCLRGILIAEIPLKLADRV